MVAYRVLGLGTFLVDSFLKLGKPSITENRPRTAQTTRLSNPRQDVDHVKEPYSDHSRDPPGSPSVSK